MRPRIAAVAALAAAVTVVAAGGASDGTSDAPAAGGPELQRSADSVQPNPRIAENDRGLMYRRGCMVDQREIRYPTCVFGKASSSTTAVLYGDSQAMHYFPPLLRLARRHGWRLVGRTRQGCAPAAVRFAYRCDKWRAETLRRIERRDRPDLIVVGSGVAYRPVVGGRRLRGARADRAMAAGYARTLRRLRRTGARVAVMKATPWAPFDPPTCVGRSLGRLRKCAFSRRQTTNRNFDARAARAVRGATLIDTTHALCLSRVCPSVIDGLLVYRDRYHLSATFARTLAPWLDRRLPRPR
jgi:hypothetical protein